MYILPLWSILPLPLLLAVWWLVVLLRWERYEPRRLALATLSGALFTFGFPIFPTTFLLFFAFVPLLIIEKQIREIDPTIEKRDTIFRYAYHTFVLWNIGATWWVSNASLLPGMIANFLNAVFMAAAFWLFHRMTRAQKIRDWQRYCIFVITWLGFEYFHQNWEINWVWLTLGNAFGANPATVQWYEWTGTFGGSLWILVLNVLAFQLWEQYRNQEFFRSTIVSAILTVVVPLCFSYFLYQKAENVLAKADKTLQIVTTQPDFEPHYTRNSMSEQQQLEKLLELSSTQVDSKTDYLLFPEAAFDVRNITEMSQHANFLRIQSFLAKYPRLKILTGIDAFRIFRPDEAATDATRTYPQPDGHSIRLEVYNATTQIGSSPVPQNVIAPPSPPEGGELEVAGLDSPPSGGLGGAITLPLHRKVKFVPGAEKIPYRSIFFFIKPIVAKFGGSFEGYGSDTVARTFSNGATQAATAICYESIFGDYCRQYVAAPNDADFFAVLTNDGWWDNTEGHRQHRMFSQLRAIELRRPVVRSAIMGNACFVNVLGEVEAQGTYGIATALKSRVKITTTQFGQTFYARWGDFIGKIAFYVILLLIVVNFFIFLKKKSVKI